MASNRITSILGKYISEKIPKKATNVLFQLFNGIEAVFVHLETRLDYYQKESNILTADSLSSLRTMAALNGYEPSLPIPSSGTVNCNFSSDVFSLYGFPLYLAPYAKLKHIETGIIFYYNSDKAFTINDVSFNIPVVEGSIISESFTNTNSETIQTIYLAEQLIANNSISIDGYFKVDSFIDNIGVNSGKQFLVKYSSNTNKPIILYVIGSKYNETLNISYKKTIGENGNITIGDAFTIENVLDKTGNEISLTPKQQANSSIYGFNMGSNGSTINFLRSAIGYNHGQNLLFDSSTYRNFLNKLSLVFIQSKKWKFKIYK